MATNEIHVKHGKQILFRHGADFTADAPATAANSIIIGTPDQTVEFDLTSLAASGGARASTKTTSIGTTRGKEHSVFACLEHASGVPVDGETVDFYWAPSPSVTAANGNPSSLAGADEVFTDTAAGLAQMQFIGSLILQATVINIGKVGIFVPFF